MSGEEICGGLVSVYHNTGPCAKSYLIRSVTDADLEGRQLGEICLDEIAQNNLKFLLCRRPLNRLCNFRCHSGIQFDSNDLFRFLKNSRRQDTRTRTDFEYRLAGLNVGLVDDGIGDCGVFQDVLADVRIELKYRRSCFGEWRTGLLIRRAGGRIALASCGFPHRDACRWS